MADQKPELGAGDVEIELAGKTETMRPSLEACLALSRGGLNRLRERVEGLDFDAITMVIAAGLSANPAQKTRLIAPAVYQTGLIRCAGPCILFLHAIANGGAIPKLSASAQALDALAELTGYVAGNDGLNDQLEPLEKLRVQISDIFESEIAEADEAAGPLAKSGSESASSTAE